MEKTNFPYDPVNRIQKLYYEYDFNDIPTVYNKNKLIKTKTKLIKYFQYCMEHVKNALTPQIEEWDKQFADLTKELDELESKEEQLKKQNLVQEKKKLHNITLNVIKRRNDVRRHNQSVSLERELVHTMCETLGLKLDYIIAQIRRIRKNYKKCNHCKKTAMITICDCKSKHKLCSECIDDKTECPVCKDDFGLQNCAICMENKNKKDFVNTGCKNEHKTCKECLDKIKKSNNMCPFCREGLGHRHALIRYQTDDMTPYNNFQDWMETNGVMERIYELSNDAGSADEVNISPRILDDVVINNMNSNPTFPQSSEEESQRILTNYHSTVHENPFSSRYTRGRGGRGGRGRIPTGNIYSREQAAELNDWTHYNEYQNWMESIGIIERIDELPNNGDTRERAITESDAPPNEQLEIHVRDIELITQQAGCTKEEAINAFKDNDMDIVSAIMYLT